MSRCVAHIEYRTPGDRLPEVWETLSRQFKVELSGKTIEEACKKWPEASGRDVKNLLKLAGILSKRSGKKVDFELLEFVAKFKT